MAQGNVSATVPQGNSGPDLVALVVVLVLLLISVCCCLALSGHLHLKSFIRRKKEYKEDARKYREGRRYNDAAIDTPDERDYRPNDTRAQRHTRSDRDRGGNHYHYYITPHPAQHGHSPRGQSKDHSQEKHAQTQTRPEEHDKGSHQTQTSTQSEDRAHSVRSDGTHSSSRVIYSTAPQDIHSHPQAHNGWNIVHPPPQPHSSNSSSYASSRSTPSVAPSHPPTLLPHPMNFRNIVPIPTLPHFSGGHPFPYQIHSKIAAQDPYDSP